jgi:hypothetical protein
MMLRVNEDVAHLQSSDTASCPAMWIMQQSLHERTCCPAASRDENSVCAQKNITSCLNRGIPCLSLLEDRVVHGPASHPDLERTSRDSPLMPFHFAVLCSSKTRCLGPSLVAPGIEVAAPSVYDEHGVCLRTCQAVSWQRSPEVRLKTKRQLGNLPWRKNDPSNVPVLSSRSLGSVRSKRLCGQRSIMQGFIELMADKNEACNQCTTSSILSPEMSCGC